MKNFAKSVLNYFAAFNETRFRFSRKLPYEWSGDSFTLDLSVFPGFQRKLLDAVATGTPMSFEVKKEQHAVSIDHDTFIASLQAAFAEQLNQEFLQNIINENMVRLKEALPEEAEGELLPRAFAEGVREYNLSCRRRFLELITEAQDQKIKALQNEYGFQSIPPSSFNSQREVQNLYDDLKKISKEHDTVESYVPAAIAHITSQNFGFIIFDLHPILRSYNQLIGTQSLYVFFQEIEKGDKKYPLFAVEIGLRDGENRIVIETPRNVVMLNTPGINSFEFDTVLTTDRIGIV
ncbi:MAG: hypothetical protein KAR13_22125 [Desulfobulbaceae bacterium]|nr:hypothetical protein [Desulfobulbaceae bacterium]